jgi:mannose-6-phosphate isomerase-like protein (cupin superfamily)
MLRAPLVALIVLLRAPSSLGAQGSSPPSPAVQWLPAPVLFPRGAQMAVLSGDPFKPVVLKVLISMPDRYRMPPHFHATDEHIEVRQGTLLVGMGDNLDPKKTIPLAVGDTATAPAGMHHYSVAKGATIVSMTIMGPYIMTYVHVRDEPWGVFPYGY